VKVNQDVTKRQDREDHPPVPFGFLHQVGLHSAIS
jgi:hypothetical protein